MTTGGFDRGAPGPLLTRRRAIAIFGSAAGLPLAALPGARARAEAGLYTWEGSALGADASITLAHPTEEGARRIVALAVAELRRLEGVFSLSRDDSEITLLNREGTLARPSSDMLALLGEARRVADLSGGAFDITVQPLWTLYSGHFRRFPDDETGPARSEIEAARKLVDYRRVVANPLFVRFEHKGMQITLNGIAQGYITDRVADLLRDNGIGHVLVSLGETRALDGHPDGRPWRVALKDPRDPSRIERSLDLVDAAVATSGGYGTVFDHAGRFHHLLDPHSGVSAWGHIGVSVIANRATTADGLSTALYVSSPADAERLARKAGKITALFTYPDGSQRTVGA